MLREFPRNLMPSGIFAVLCGGLAAISFFKDPDLKGLERISFLPGDIEDLKVAIVFAIIATIGGGILCLIGRGVGAPIAAGGGPVVVGGAPSLVGVPIGFNGVFCLGGGEALPWGRGGARGGAVAWARRAG